MQSSKDRCVAASPNFQEGANNGNQKTPSGGSGIPMCNGEMLDPGSASRSAWAGEQHGAVNVPVVSHQDEAIADIPTSVPQD